DLTQERTAAYGLPAYEISNHARPRQGSSHNLTYSRYGEYAGIGPGAQRRLRIGGVRRATAALRRQFSRSGQGVETGDGLVNDDHLTWGEEGDEYLGMGLRLREGIGPNRYQALARRPLTAVQISHLTDIGFIETLANGRLRVTDKGLPVLDAVVADL